MILFGGRNPAHQLRLVVYSIIYRVMYIPGRAGFPPYGSLRSPRYGIQNQPKRRPVPWPICQAVGGFENGRVGRVWPDPPSNSSKNEGL